MMRRHLIQGLSGSYDYTYVYCVYSVHMHVFANASEFLAYFYPPYLENILYRKPYDMNT